MNELLTGHTINHHNIKSASFWLISAALLTFLIGFVHHTWFFPLFFDGDAASIYALAKAIFDQGSVLPTDFNYGNQIVFLRSSVFIALAFMAGLTGYPAFIIGSSLSIAVWGILLYLFLSEHFNSRGKGLLFSILLLIPLGSWDVDFVLGQQSHLSNIVLAIGIVTSLNRNILNKSHTALFVACLCLFVMSSEAPIRGLLVLAPTLIAFAMTLASTSGLKRYLRVSTSLLCAFALAFVVHGLLIYFYPLKMNFFSALTFHSGPEFFDNFLRVMLEMADSISSFNTVNGTQLSVLGAIVFASGLLLVIGYFVFIIKGAVPLEKVINLTSEHFRQRTLDDQKDNFVSLVAVLGVVVGAFAVAGLNPDSSRHFIWAIFLVKLCLIVSLYNFSIRFISKSAATLFVFFVCLMMSAWFANLVIHNWNTRKSIEAINHSEVMREIKIVSEKTNIRHIFGEDFWRMMPLNTLMPNIESQALILWEGEIYPQSWLNRPSWSCNNRDVIYYLKSGSVDQVIKKKLTEVGGSKVYDGHDFSLWVGSKIWLLLDDKHC